MKIVTEKNIKLISSRPFLADAIFPDSKNKMPLIIFVHGYKGYKDWGTWELMGKALAREGFYFVKFNMSYNGTTLENPCEFGDLEAFGQNNYSKELEDLEEVIRYFREQPQVDAEQIILIGHSRGGGVSIIKASENRHITKLITLASVSTLNRFPKDEAFENWKKEGVFYVLNGRTRQQMPHYFQFYQDFERHQNRFDIHSTCHKLRIPALFIHGTQDEAVSHTHSEKLYTWTKDAQLKLIENAGHTFGAKEPWESAELPEDQQKVVEAILRFIKEN